MFANEGARENNGCGIGGEPPAYGEAENLQTQMELALRLTSLGKWTAAADVFRKVLQGDPRNGTAMAGLGNCLLHLNQPGEALDCFEAFERLGIHGIQALALFGKAVALHRSQRFEEAEAAYLRALDIEPNLSEALSNLAVLSIELFDLGRAERYSSRLLAIDPNAPAALKAMIVVAAERRDFAEAGRFYERLVQTGSTHKFPANPDDDAVQYRMSRANFDRMKSAGRGDNQGKRDGKPKWGSTRAW